MDKLNVIGIDLAKRVVSICRIDGDGVIVNQTLSRDRLLDVAAQWPISKIGMEACGMAHHFARAFLKLGHSVIILPASRVVPYRIGGKNDRNDARAIADCIHHRDEPGVPVKSIEQQTELSLHRLREGKKEERTAAINRMRGLLLEFGISFVQGARGVVEMMRFDLSGIPSALHAEIRRQREWMQLLDAAIDQLSREIAELAKSRRATEYARLQTLPSIGPLTASAIGATIGDGTQFKNGRQFAAWLGLTPRQYSTGGKTQLGRITRRGDAYVRTLLIQGARSALQVAMASPSPTRLQVWMIHTCKRIGYHKTLVAIANKQARLVWCLLTRKTGYHADTMPPAAMPA
ncbi:IS110 family transposase [Burkholderiaceae bacterium DAT-1]|nr:IS110 family transposase [Burkholderiaceae bacterium DAT-1]